MKNLWISTAIAIAVSASLLSAQSRGDLVSDTVLLEFDKQTIQSVYAGFGIPELLFPIHFEKVDLHRIKYLTPDARGDSLILASGLVSLPVSAECDFPLLVYNHGSLAYDETLSELMAKLDQHFIGIPMAANGYVGVLPDLLGYGATPLYHPHPYIHAQSEASAAVDMLRAARILCQQENIGLNDQLFLMGYSQGGHTTMAMHQALEFFHVDEFTVTASAPCSGPYDVSGIMYDSLLQSPVFSNPFFIGFVTLSYQFAYQNLFDEIGDVFKAPYDSLIFRMLNRYDPESYLRDSLPTPGVQMFEDGYLLEMIIDPGHPFRTDLRDNDLYAWTPQAPVRLYYCTEDEQVPYVNALFTADTMLASGADVQAIDAGPYDHFACTPFALIGAKLWFDTRRIPCVVGTSPVADNEPAIYPNPFSEALHIRLWDAGLWQITLYDAIGRIAFSTHQQGAGEVRLPGKALAPGVYVLKIQDEAGRCFVRKVIRQ